MNKDSLSLPASAETGSIPVMHLKRYWEKSLARKSGHLPPDALQEEWNTDQALLATLNLGLEQTIKYVYLFASDFAGFEKWILDVNGGAVDLEKIKIFNNTLLDGSKEVIQDTSKVLSPEELDSWNKNGYIIIRNAVSKEDCEALIEVICDFIGIKRDDPSTWYNASANRQGIMVQLFQHPLLDKNRQAEKIRRTYEQLWGRKDIWVNTDRVGFNPPETTYWKFPGPRLHWDVSLQLPIPFGLQGIHYLADTAANQGAFTLVPGFHHKIEHWLNSLPPGTSPRNENIEALGAIPVVANAGDFIVWHHALPHGSSPNSSGMPRFVQYINYAPADMEIREKWI